MTDAEPSPADDTEVVAREETEPAADDAETEITDPDELMKQKYRDAMAHKHGASGATTSVSSAGVGSASVMGVSAHG
jgi:hypothetical protein